MKNIILSIAFGSLLLCSCQKAEEMKYTGTTNVVFGTTSDTLTPIVYSFLEHPEVQDKDTILVPIRIQGNRAAYDRQIKVSVVADKTTAIAGTQYEALKPEYIMPADSGLIRLPVIVKKGDSRLNVAPVVISLKIEPTKDFSVNPKMQYTTVTFSNIIQEPTWWGYWYDSQNNFPKFSVTAYSLVTKVTGRSTFETSANGGSSLFYITVYSMLYVWSPFYNAAASGESSLNNWIASHPGWKLVKHSGDEYYDFYQENDMSTKFKYGPVASGSTVFGFFDEKGNVVKK